MVQVLVEALVLVDERQAPTAQLLVAGDRRLDEARRVGVVGVHVVEAGQHAAEPRPAREELAGVLEVDWLAMRVDVARRARDVAAAETLRRQAGLLPRVVA